MTRSGCRMFACGIAVLAIAAIGGESHAPVELGKVPWLRDYDAAIAKAKEEKKPILLLFQEVPG